MVNLSLRDRTRGIFVDISSFIDPNTLKFSTDQYGHKMLSCSIVKNRNALYGLFSTNKNVDVRLGEAGKSFWEGRLENISITNVSIDIVCYGYIRAFSDLQVTDLWSTTDYGKWKPSIKEFSAGVQFDATKYNFENDRRLFIGLKANTIYGSQIVGAFDYYLPSGHSRGFQCAVFTTSGSSLNSFGWAFGLRQLPGGSTTDTTTSSNLNPLTTTYAFSEAAYAQIRYIRNAGNALYVGEDNSQYLAVTNLRIGTTLSISGGRLYADEILRYYADEVRSLNTDMISSDYTAIESPAYDLKNVGFEDVSGFDVIKEMLRYPDSSGNPWEFKIWEDKRIIFRRKQSDRTWRILESDLRINRTLDSVKNQVRVMYRNEQDMDIRTEYVTDTTIAINRQATIGIDVTTDSDALIKARESLESSKDPKSRSDIETRYAYLNGARYPAHYIRSGDTVILISSNFQIQTETESFIVLETEYDNGTGFTKVIPEILPSTLETIYE